MYWIAIQKKIKMGHFWLICYSVIQPLLNLSHPVLLKVCYLDLSAPKERIV